MELEKDSSPRPNSLDLSQSAAGSIHSVVRNSRHASISKSIIDMDATPALVDATGEIKGTAPSNPVTVVSSASLKNQKFRGRIQFAVLCWSLFLLGWNDGCTGPLLPRIQEVYHVGRRDH
jgi:hypothetical protein